MARWAAAPPMHAHTAGWRLKCTLSAWSRHFSGAPASVRHEPAPSTVDTRMLRLARLRTHLREDTRTLQAFTPAAGQPGAPMPSPSSTPELLQQGALLRDRFERVHTYVRVSLTERCNLRCQYCMPAEGARLTPADHLLQAHELYRLLRVLHAHGVRKVRLTGGEPTLRRDLVDIVAHVRDMGMTTIAMTTNGIALQPLLEPLRSAGMTHINISLDSLQRERFARVTRRTPAHWDRAWAALHAALELGFAQVKVNVVVMRGVNDDEVGALCALAQQLPVEVRFIELMPFAGNAWEAAHFVSYEEQLRAARLAFPDLAPMHAVDAHETSKLWAAPGFVGRVGFITSMSDAFCGTCNRLRITADGKLKACLHGSEETDLRPALRGGASDATLASIVAAALQRKHLALGGHADMLALAQQARSGNARPMITIGG